jgi:hypothetical protein
MSGEGTSPHVACRAVLLAAGLLLFGARSGQLRDRDYGADQNEDHDQHLKNDPEARHVHRQGAP